jgi:trehalose 6-phosphate synthase
MYDFVVVANRLPVDQVTDADGHACWQRSPGGLVTALHPLMKRRGGAWIGWHGSSGPAPEPFDNDGVRLQAVELSEEEIDSYYEGQSNATIWPLYHDAVETPVFDRAWRDAYRVVNQRFAQEAARLAAPGATVWVHDYHLQLVPGMLRALRPDLKIGFFLHIPFPPVELFMRLPLRAEILEGLLGADLIGFQQPLAAQNFLRLCRLLLGLRTEASRITVGDRQVVSAAFPISIDAEEITGMAHDPLVRERAEQIRAELGHPQTILLGVDRLDYTKGIEQRLTAYGELLTEHSLDPASTVLVQVAVPSRQRIAQYQTLRERVERTVGRINGEHAEVGRSAVHYLHRSYSREELVALYLAADVMVVTPLRDGMNLVAKEYVAARVDGDGALVLSEFAGAAAELRQAYQVNPHDVDRLKETLMRAVTAEVRERRRRMRAMRTQVHRNDVNRWARNFLSALEDPARALPVAQPDTPTVPPQPTSNHDIPAERHPVEAETRVETRPAEHVAYPVPQRAADHSHRVPAVRHPYSTAGWGVASGRPSRSG